MLFPGTKKALRAQCDHALHASKGCDYPSYVTVDKEDQFKFAVTYIRGELYNAKALVSEDACPMYTFSRSPLNYYARLIRARNESGMTYYVCVLLVIPPDLIGHNKARFAGPRVPSTAKATNIWNTIRFAYTSRSCSARESVSSLHELQSASVILCALLKQRRWLVMDVSQQGASIRVTFVKDSFDTKFTVTFYLDI